MFLTKKSRHPSEELCSLFAGGRWAALVMVIVLLTAMRVQAFDTVILDPGHGGHDRGAAIGYVYEKHLALDTARRVQQLLTASGLKVIMTRDSDIFIPLEGRSRAGRFSSWTGVINSAKSVWSARSASAVDS